MNANSCPPHAKSISIYMFLYTIEHPHVTYLAIYLIQNLMLKCLHFFPLPDYYFISECRHVRNKGGTFAAPEIFKTLHSNFDICKNFQRIKMKFYDLIIFKKSYGNSSLFCSLNIISLQDLS